MSCRIFNAWILASVTLSGGCAGLQVTPVQLAPAEDSKDDREMVASYDKQRDAVQLAAAKSRLIQGDERGGIAALQQLLSRNPHHREARLLLAESCLAQGTSEVVLEDIQSLAAQDSRDARSQHTLAMLLDAVGRRSEALHYYERAAAIDPKNDLFTASYQAAAASLATKPRS